MRAKRARLVGAASLALALAHGGCVRAPAGAAPAAAPPLDLARKPGALPSREGEPEGSPLYAPPPAATGRPRLAVATGGIAFDGGMDVGPAPFVGARASLPIGRGLEVIVPAKVAWIRAERVEAVGGTTGGPPSPRAHVGPLGLPPPPPTLETVAEDATLAVVEVGLARRFLAPTWAEGPWSGTVGLAAGVALFRGLGDRDDDAASVSASATLERRVSRRGALWLEATLHAFHTEVGGGDRTWRPAAALGLGFSVDL
jgi:hypothetical protein